MYVIRNSFRNVINPKGRNIQVLRLDDIQFALRTDYIRLAAITYQSFGLDKKSRSEERDFSGTGVQKRTPHKPMFSGAKYPEFLNICILPQKSGYYKRKRYFCPNMCRDFNNIHI